MLAASPVITRRSLTGVTFAFHSKLPIPPITLQTRLCTANLLSRGIGVTESSGTASAAKFINKIKKHWIIVLIVGVGSTVIFADNVVQAARHFWETLQSTQTITPKAVPAQDKFELSGVEMAFVLSYLSNNKLKVEGETVVPIFENKNDYPVTVQFERIAVSVNGQEAPAVPPDDMTITFPMHNGPAGWFGSDPRVRATNGDVLHGEIDAKLRYFNSDNGLNKQMTIRGKVVARLPSRGRIVRVEWWPDTDSARAVSQAAHKLVVLGPPQVPLTPRDMAILKGQVAAE